MKIEDYVKEHLKWHSETATEIACFCPWHPNNDTPSLSINKRYGAFYCFNPSCGAKGSFRALQAKIGVSAGILEAVPSEDELLEMLNYETKEPDWDAALERTAIDYENESEVEKLEYLIRRGFSVETLREFDIGYSERRDRIVIPVRNENYKVVGFIGRATDNIRIPKYQYSLGFPRGGTLFNLNNAKHFKSALVVEGSLDAISIHQAGYKSVVATLGANVSVSHCLLLKKYFNEITIISDADSAGEAMKCGIIEGAKTLDIWVTRLPEGIKDPGEMNEEQIDFIIENRTNILDEKIRED